MLSWILVIIVVSLCLGLGSIVYFKNPREKINKIFIILVFLVVIWILSNYLENEPIDHALASLFLRIDFASAALLVYFFFLFAVNFQRNFLIPSVLKQALASLPVLILFVLSFSNLIITRIGFENNIISFERGPLFPLYAILLLGYVTTGCIDLILKYKKLKGIERIQTLYVLLGFSFSAFIALIINLFFQNLLPVSMFRIGNYGVFFFIGFTTFAILRHHLLEIKVVLTELLVGIIAVVLFSQIFTSEANFDYIWKGALFLAFLVLGYLLIQSVIREIERRAEFQRLFQQVDKLSKTKSEFISIASHQLRTPLTAIKGYISMLMEGTYGKFLDKQKKPMENVYQSNERLIKLVNDLLNLSRLEAGRLEFNPQSISLEEIVAEVVKELKINAENKELYIKMAKFPKPLPQVMADRDKLRQVILNIIDNAIKYTKKGGVIIKLNKIGNWEQIKISDTGEGLDRKEIKNLFQMFSRAAAGTQLHVEGAGIGLHVAKKFVEMHNGKIWAESPGRGKGSTFYIELKIR